MLSIFVCCLPIFIMVITTCERKDESVSQYSNVIFEDSTESEESMVINDDTSASEIPSKSFSNGIYSIKYPNDWVVTRNQGENTDVIIESSKYDISLQIIHYKTDKSLDEIQNNLDSKIIEVGFDVVGKQELSIGGQNAFGRVYFKINENADFMTDDGGTVLMVYNLKRDGILYNVKFSSSQSQMNEDIVRNIIKTFSFV